MPPRRIRQGFVKTTTEYTTPGGSFLNVRQISTVINNNIHKTYSLAAALVDHQVFRSRSRIAFSRDAVVNRTMIPRPDRPGFCRPDAITGQWLEIAHNVSGSLSGRASGASIQAVASSGPFSANLTLTTMAPSSRCGSASRARS